MDFPLGSLAALIVFILLSSGLVQASEYYHKVLVLGLAGILVGSFVNIPLPAPKGIEAALNVGSSLVPLLIAAMLWLEAASEERYRISLVTLTAGLVIYGASTVLELEPGLTAYPQLFIIPFVASLAAVTGRTPLASAVGLTGASSLVTCLRYFELTWAAEPGTIMELPGNLMWNTLSLGVIGSVAGIHLVTAAGQWVKGRFRLKNSTGTHGVSEELRLEEAEQPLEVTVSQLEGD